MMQASDNERNGLSWEEAERLTREGKANEMPKAKDGGVAEILRRNLLTLFNLLNLLLALALFLVGSYRNMLFLGVVFSNAFIGTFQELRAKRTHDRLKLLSESHVRVLRDGKETTLSPRELVLGDVVVLTRGEQIPADAVVLSGAAHVDESLLTGESVPVVKEPNDKLFSGSFLTEGSVTARLTEVGADSYAGKLQLSARKVKRAESELMRDLKQIIRLVSILILPIGGLLYWKQYIVLEQSMADSVTACVASMLGMIPEGLMLLTSVALAVGVVRLGKRKAMVNELYGIETLARTDVVCMDKTGTLTSGEMTLAETVPLGGAEQEDIARRLGALLATFHDPTPTNNALMKAYPMENAPAPEGVVPFSSERKWSAARFESLGTVVLGAPEKTLSGEALAMAQKQAEKGMRVLALLQTDAPIAGEALPDGLRPMALLCLRDSLRPRVRETVRYFGEQGVTLKVISGDSPLTVSHVAQDAGVPNAERMIDLSAVEGTPDYQAISRAYTVFGRVSPEDKRMLVEAMKADGHGVAMVGDGVNDIPALKAADCSIAMAGGSDAASRVAQITLLNADFEVMPEIVLEGRRVINNIARAASLFLVKNLYSFLLSLAMLALPFSYPFAPIQLTLVSALTIGVPTFVLAMQPNRERVRGSFLKNVVLRALPGGVCVTLLVVCNMLTGNALGLTSAAIETLCTLIAGCSGLTVLVLTCLPMDAIRATLCVLMAAAFAGSVELFPQVFYLVPIQGVMWWMLLVSLVLCPVIQLGMAALLRQRMEPKQRKNSAKGSDVIS